MKDGQSAANTKLDPASPAYKALVEKKSYTGPATVLGKDYQANYAPLTSGDGKLTGALSRGHPEIVGDPNRLAAPALFFSLRRGSLSQRRSMSPNGTHQTCSMR